MTVTEILPTLRALNHKEKIRVIQFLANEVAREENILFAENQDHEFISQTDSFEASLVLQKLIEERKADAIT
jgi:hypothetical protein